jgi:hypothetical protein
MRYIHPSEDRILDAISRLGGHNSGHNDDSKNLTAGLHDAEVIETGEENW